jgi:hypothetical protein
LAQQIALRNPLDRQQRELARLALAALRIRLARPGEQKHADVQGQVITAEYKALNEQMHREREGYGVQGRYHIRQVRLLARLVSRDILDYGCGKRLVERGLGFPIRNYDPGIPGLDARPDPADVVVCLDVLEHIEPELLDHVLADLARVTRRAGYFTVSVIPAKKTLPDGRNAHLIVQPREWWEDRLGRLFHIRLRADSEEHALFVVQRR